MKAALTLIALALPFAMHAQMQDNGLEVGLRYSTTAANAPPGSCGCFFLQGAAVDASVPILPRLRAVVEAGGGTVANVPASNRGLSEITLLAGPRYILPMHRWHLNTQALFGAVRGFDSDFILTNSRHTDTSTNFAMAIGSSVEVPITRNILLRPIQVDYLQTDLPNGVDDRQRNVRIGAGLTFRLHLPDTRR